MLIDTHTHLYLPEFEGGGAEAVDRALAVDVGHMIFPNVDLTTIEPMRALHAQRPEVTSMAMGLHPTEVGESWRDDLAIVRNEFEANIADYVAVGEIGMDLYWEQKFENEQMQALAEQLAWAQEHNLPVIIHCRNALAPTLEVLFDYKNVRGVMHSFGGTEQDVDAVRKVNENMRFGINGIVTFKNCNVRNVLPAIGLDWLLLETDSPYLAPVPHRGKRCESAMIVNTAKHIAMAMGISEKKLSDSTTANACELFPIA